MLKNPSITEFEASVTMRVLLDRFIDRRYGTLRTQFTYDEAFSQAIYASNDVLRDLGINRELWVRARGRRAYLFHEPTNRIAAELGIVSDEAGRGTRKRLRIVLIGKKGVMRHPTIGDIAVETAKLGTSDYNKRGKRNTNRKGERR